MQYDESLRQEKLRMARQSFAGRKETAEPVKQLSYMQDYILRSIIAAVLVLVTFLYGIANEKKQQEWITRMIQICRSNPTWEQAVETYRKVDYEKMFKEAITYARQITR